MSSISTGGSGLDIPTLVSQLVAAERAPTEARINSQGTTTNNQITAIGRIRSAMTTLQTSLNDLRSASSSPTRTSTVQSGGGFSASATSGAPTGRYSVEVERLATAQKLASAGHATDETFGEGTLTIDYGGEEPLVVEIAANASLQDIANAINRAAGGVGVSASLITADSGQHLQLNATSTGTANALTVTASSGDGSLEALAGSLDETVAATDALVRVDGFERTSSSNTLADLIPGVTLTLTKADAGTAYNLTVGSDDTNLKSKLNTFITSYNSVMSTLTSTSRYDASTQTPAALTGDSLVRGLQQQLRSQLSANSIELRAIGITVSTSGTLSLDSAALDAALASNPKALDNLLGNEGKLSSTLTTVLDTALNSTNGTLTQRNKSLNDRIAALEEQLDDLDDRMTALSSRYTAQFTAMETMIVQLQGNASSLNGLLASLND